MLGNDRHKLFGAVLLTGVSEIDSFITLSAISKNYGRGRKASLAIKDISLTVNQGEFVIITGESGSGKSTLLNIISGIDTPNSGRVEVAGNNLLKLSDKKLAVFRGLHIGFIFQSYYLQPFLKVRSNIALASVPLKVDSRSSKERVKELASELGIADQLDKFPRQLSGGQVQRVAIARALFNKPELIIADEPTGSLDEKNSLILAQTLEGYRRQFGTTIVMATHDSSMLPFASRTVNLDKGVVTS